MSDAEDEGSAQMAALLCQGSQRAALRRAVRVQCRREEFTTGKVLLYSSGGSTGFNVISPQDSSCSSLCSHSADRSPPAPSALAAVGNESEAVMEAQLLVGRAGRVLLSSPYCRSNVSTEPLPSLFFSSIFSLSISGHPDLFCSVCFTFGLNVSLKAIVANMPALSLPAVISPTVESHSIWKCFQALNSWV